jgi:hypothetical protein
MSTDFAIKPVGPPVATAVVQPRSLAAAVATELPASQSVTVAVASASASNDQGSMSGDVSHQVTFDRDADTIVYQSVDPLTNLVLQQFPDEAVLRRRAYFHTLDLTKDQPTRLLATDRKA